MKRERRRRAGLPAACQALALASALATTGAVWRVERDGTGDFTTIQPAIAAASPGDTILIGPGRYTEFSEFWPGVNPYDTYVGVDKDNLSLIGRDRERTVIGPHVRNFYMAGPKGIATHRDVTRLAISNLTLVNTYDGVWSTRADLKMWDCTTDSCGNGVSSGSYGFLDVRNCLFKHSRYGGVATYRATICATIEDCEFEGGSINNDGVTFVYTQNAKVQRCTFRGGWVGVDAEGGARCEVIDCRFEDVLRVGISVVSGAQATLTGNVVRGGYTCLGVNAPFSRATGTRNVFRDADKVVRIAGGNVAMQGNHILAAREHLVYLLASASFTPPLQDLRNNYWGMADRDSIAAAIWDGHDDPAINGFVQFEPFATRPLPAERKSLGTVKDLFRRR